MPNNNNGQQINVYGGPRNTVNKKEIVQVLNRAVNSGTTVSKPNIRFSKARQVVKSGARHFVVFAAVSGFETLLPKSVMPSDLTVQLCFGAALPTIQAAYQGRVSPALAVTFFWLITFRGFLGIRETMLITRRSSYFDPVTRVMGRALDLYKGSAPSNSVRYAILYYLAQFLRAYYQTMGYPVYASANNFGRSFARNFSGNLGRSLVTLLRSTGSMTGTLLGHAIRHPLGAAATSAAVGLVLSRKRKVKTN